MTLNRKPPEKSGRFNWEDFGQTSTAPATPEMSKSSLPASLQTLGGIVIKGSRISDGQFTVSNLNLDVGNVSRRAAVPVKASFDLDTGPAGSQTSFDAALTITLDSVAKHYGLEAVSLSGELRQHNNSHSLRWNFLAPAVEADLGAQTLKAPSFTMQAGSARLSGSLSGEKIINAPVFGGSVKLQPLVLREFLALLGVELPKTRDKQALSTLAASTDFSYTLKAVRLEKLNLQLDETHLRGELMVPNLHTEAMTFDLSVDRIDLSRYLAPAGTAPQSTARAPDREPTELPTDAVRALNATGRFSIGTAKVAGMTLSNLHLNLKAQNGLVHLAPVNASLYGGEYSGDITYDAREATPRVKLDQQVTGVDIAPLLKDSIQSEWLSGRGNVSAQLAGAGRTTEALTRNLTGRVTANLADGALNGIDIWYEINLAQALLKQQPAPAGSDDRRTKFDSFKMSADIAAGIATTKDLTIASQYLRVTGTGNSNLVTRAIDYHIVATILKAPVSAQRPELSQLTLADVPVEISGTMVDPKVRPDLQGIVRSKLKQRLQDTVKEKLEGIFNR